MTLRNWTGLTLITLGAWAASSCASGASDSVCGNHYCEASGGETITTCTEDCFCQNGTCDPGETTATCPSDCYCGNGVCDPGETLASCQLDCAGPVCGDGVCTGGETLATCPVDCGSGVCGDGVCNGAETAATCPADCGSGACGDNICQSNEVAGTCPQDCFCGNGSCDGGETAASCPADCTASYCGDGTCDGNESAASCPQDCASSYCGDGTCDAGEDSSSCPADCGGSCTYTPCDLYPQCGCQAGQKCTLDSANNKVCLTAGSTSAGGTCTAETDCNASSMCLGRTTSVGQCLGFCNPTTQAGCTGGSSYCVELVDSAQTPIPGAGVCTITCTPHNPSAACGSFGCQIYQHNITQVVFTDCDGDVGTGTDGASCNSTSGPFCAPGYGCFNDGVSDLCFQWCTLTSSCVVGFCDTAAFNPAIVVNNTTYGVCR
ncbi:MAG: hypothetical protein ABI333_27465 [bacterium]